MSGSEPGLLDRRLLFVTGKGGVGKTSIAASLAMLSAQRGRRTLVCEVDAKGDLADAFECPELAFERRELAPNLWGMAMDTEESLREYLRLQLKVPLLGRIGPVARTFDFVADAAPGVKEILTVGKLCHEVRERNYDLIVVDASATGHVVGQLAAPQAINELVKVGRVREQTRWMVEILADRRTTAAVIVSSPEEMPVAETLELSERLRAETDVHLAAVIVNRVLPELFGRGEEEVFTGLRKPAGVRALTAALVSASGAAEPSGGADAPVSRSSRRSTPDATSTESVTALLDAALLAVTLRRTRAEHLTRLRAELDPTVPLVYVPYLFTRAHGVRATRALADALSAEIDD
ncbi:MAG TPA: ArsA family ATPase [Acidimicrobiales bacterium]|nr:ArsA family ATPase [Acidimicrobiales bacterium]